MMKDKEADELFKKEITKDQVERGAHFTYRDGFRLGFGIFVGLMVGSTILLAIIWALSKVF